MDVSRTDKERTVMIEKVHNALILSLGDKVLWKVSKEKTEAGVWRNFKVLYMKKYLVNCIYLKQSLYSFKISEDKVLIDQLDMFNKLILNLENIEIKIDDEDHMFLLLCDLPKSHTRFKETLLYGR